jgi:NADH-quinone oxidoreductase subunit L
MPTAPELVTQSAPLMNIVLFLPLAVALVILLGRKVLGVNVCVFLAVASSAICLLCSIFNLGVVGSETIRLMPFLFLDGGKLLNVGIDVLHDGQSAGMMFIVTLIGFLVQVFSVKYMEDDDAKPRYFGALSLFLFSMTGIVLADNLVMMFVFWELVGLSSFLLIGHWFQKPSAAEASKKAFLTNRIGDFGFMIGILLLFGANHGDVSFAGLRESLMMGPLKASVGTQGWLMTAAVLCLFMGAVGKSAQVPLHVWLPDAMEGPTPVSALIHAATMVAAGVYMLVRISFLIAASETGAMWIAGIGGVTALMAALMATQQGDIKRILAYSTLSQLGYMVMAVGLVGMTGEAMGGNAGHPAMFHLYTHAFFKAMLFLGAGAIIYSCHHEQDIWKMGGLAKHMPATTLTFAIGTAALIGVPGLSGFFSKEAILGVAWGECKWLFAIGAFTALLTAFYMTRLFIVAFLGKARSESASHAMEVRLPMLVPLLVLAFLSIFSGYHFLGGPLKAMAVHGHGEGHYTVMGISIAALLIGVVLAFVLYKGKDKDPVNIKLFANKFYIDEIYAGLIKVFQDGLAWVVTGIEHVLVDGLVARLPAALVAKVGQKARLLQAGQLQGYTFLLGAGVILAIYVIVFVLPGVGH